MKAMGHLMRVICFPILDAKVEYLKNGEEVDWVISPESIGIERSE